MARTRTTTLYPHPFSKAYWRDAAAELKDIKMLVITALLIALRIALKPFAIHLGPQMAIQTATLATALGAMIFGPVVAIPAAIISDTVGFVINPNGDYFLPFVLTEIASTMAYALCLYRAKPTTTRVIISRFLICFVVNVVLQQFIISWQYTYLGNPEKAKETVMGIMTTARIFKNLFFFPIESVVITLFLRTLVPITAKMGLTFDRNANLHFSKKQIAVLALLVVVGIGSAVGYLVYSSHTETITKNYTAEQVVERNKTMHEIILEQNDSVDADSTVAVIEFAVKPMWGKETTYTVALYQVVEGAERTEDMWSLKKTPASKHPDLELLAKVTIVAGNEDDVVSSFKVEPPETKK